MRIMLIQWSNAGKPGGVTWYSAYRGDSAKTREETCQSLASGRVLMREYELYVV